LLADVSASQRGKGKIVAYFAGEDRSPSITTGNFQLEVAEKKKHNLWTFSVYNNHFIHAQIFFSDGVLYV
jgi:hypothetical protein